MNKNSKELLDKFIEVRKYSRDSELIVKVSKFCFIFNVTCVKVFDLKNYKFVHIYLSKDFKSLLFRFSKEKMFKSLKLSGNTSSVYCSNIGTKNYLYKKGIILKDMKYNILIDNFGNEKCVYLKIDEKDQSLSSLNV